MLSSVTKKVIMGCGPKYEKADMTKAMIGGYKKSWANLKINGLDGTQIYNMLVFLPF